MRGRNPEPHQDPKSLKDMRSPQLKVTQARLEPLRLIYILFAADVWVSDISETMETIKGAHRNNIYVSPEPAKKKTHL